MVTTRFSRAFDAITTHLILAFFAILFVFPVAYALMTSFKSKGEVLTSPPTFFPSQWTTEGYQGLFFGSDRFRSPCLIPYQLRITLFTPFLPSSLPVSVPSLATYTFSPYPFTST